MTRDEILTRLFKEGHITLEELRILDENPGAHLYPVIPFDPGPTPPYVPPGLPYYFYNTSPTINCQVSTPGIDGAVFDVNIKQQYFAGVDPIQTDNGKVEVYILKNIINES